jgi:transketolase
MRTAFIKTLEELAQENQRIWLLCGDLGYSVLESFAERFPSRFVNMGVAEQNMMGVAAGLALSGKIVFVYSIVNFPIMRCLEQIRNDICYHHLNVKIVAIGGGLAYGSHGYTHHGVEDLAVVRVLPHMKVFAPGDPLEAQWVTRTAAEIEGPCYLRLGKAGEPILHTSIPDLQLGRAIIVREGSQLTLVSTGGVLELALKASEALEARGYSVDVLSLPTLSPFDSESLIRSARKTQRVITVEEHGLGGLASLAAEALVEAGVPTQFKALRLNREPTERADHQEALRAKQGLSVKGITETAERLFCNGF